MLDLLKRVGSIHTGSTDPVNTFDSIFIAKKIQLDH